MSKLYTDEQVKQMIDDAHNGIDGYYYIFKKHTPIQLPTNEEIDNASLLISSERMEFIKGAKWMRDKIKGGNNE